MHRVVALVLPLAVVACVPETEIEPNDDELERISLGVQADAGLTVELLAEAPLKVGWNPIWFRLTHEDQPFPVTEAEILQSPWMQMTDMGHGCPYTDPEPTAGDGGLFAGELVLIMASGMMGTWSDTVSVDLSDESQHVVVFDALEVAETNTKKSFTVGDQPHVVTFTPRGEVGVGEVPFVLTVHRKESMSSFPPVDDLEIAIATLMPDMGHGSDGNVAPTYVANGRYEGTVVFNMTGHWDVTFSFRRGETDLGTVVYGFDL